MTGPEHYQAAEKLLAKTVDVLLMEDISWDTRMKDREVLIAMAQVHATLALTMATALAHTTPSDESDWRLAQREG